MSREAQTGNRTASVTVAECLYLALFLVLFGYRALGLSEGNPIYSLTLVLAAGCFVIKLLATPHTLYEYAIIAAFLALGLAVYYASGEKGLLLNFAWMLGVKEVRLENVFRAGAWVLGITMPVIFLLAIFGLVPEKHFRGGRFGNAFRRSMGYQGENVVLITYMVFMVCVLYLYREAEIKKLIFVSLLLYAGSWYVFLYCISYTGMAGTTLLILSNLWFAARKRISRAEGILCTLAYPAIALFALITPLLIDSERMGAITASMYYRFYFSHYFLTHYPYRPFGVRLGELPDPSYFIDNSYVYLFLQLGVISFAIVGALYLLFMRHAATVYESAVLDVTQKQPVFGMHLTHSEAGFALALSLTTFVAGMTEPFLFNLSCKNLTFLLMGKVLYEWTQNLKETLPETWRREYLFFRKGPEEAAAGTATLQSLQRLTEDVQEELGANKKRYAGLFAGVFLVMQPLNRMLSAELLKGNLFAYTNSVFADYRILATFEDAKEGYSGEALAYTVFRNGLSMGLYAGALVVLVVCIFRIISKRKRNMLYS